MAKAYPLNIENIGEDVYTLMSRGHHDIHEFMKAVRSAGYRWPLGVPEHTYFHATPPPDGYSAWYSECPSGTRGSFPVTTVVEAWGPDSYESKFPEHATASSPIG